MTLRNAEILVYALLCVRESTPDQQTVNIKEGLKKYGVFYSLDSIKEYLQSDEWKHSMDAKKLLYDYNRFCGNVYVRPKNMEDEAYRGFVSIESFEHAMNDSGTYMVGSKLAMLIQGKLFMCPARCLRHLRMTFRDIGGPLQNAYYALSNYGMLKEVESFFYSRYVIITRYWHSTAAYGIAQAISDGMDIPSNSDVYKWPSDLYKPNVTFFYAVTDDYDFLNTTEEPLTFTDRVRDAYRLMRDPDIVKVSAEDDTSVAAAIKEIMIKKLGGIRFQKMSEADFQEIVHMKRSRKRRKKKRMG